MIKYSGLFSHSNATETVIYVIIGTDKYKPAHVLKVHLKFLFVTVWDHQSNEPSKEVFTLATCNVLLANETFCRWNNNGNPLARSKLIGMYYIVVSAIMSHRCSFHRFFFHVSLFANLPKFFFLPSFVSTQRALLTIEIQ